MTTEQIIIQYGNSKISLSDYLKHSSLVNLCDLKIVSTIVYLKKGVNSVELNKDDCLDSILEYLSFDMDKFIFIFIKVVEVFGIDKFTKKDIEMLESNDMDLKHDLFIEFLKRNNI